MQTSSPLISAIIPTYRRPETLRRAILSVLNQTYPHLRVCVFDNASGDETAAVVAEIAREDPRIAYYCHRENIGMSANFAYAMAHVETPYFSMLSDDDYYHPTFYETAMNGFARYPGVMLSAAATVMVHANGSIKVGSPAEGYFTPPEGFLLWVQTRGPSVTSMVFRRDVIEHVGLIDQTIFHADLDYLWRITARFPFVTSARPGLIFTIHARQSTRQADMETPVHSYLMLRERVRATPDVSMSVRKAVDAFLRARFSRSVLYAGLAAIGAGDYRRGERAAAILRASFDQKGRASLLGLLARGCGHIPPVRRPARLLARTTIHAATTLAQFERDTRSNSALRAEITAFTRQARALSAFSGVSSPGDVPLSVQQRRGE
jgi:glycosyltransferase involved in cell wall biosynthesis